MVVFKRVSVESQDAVTLLNELNDTLMGILGHNGTMHVCMDDFKRLQFAADNSFVYNPNARDCWIRVNDGEPLRIPAGENVKL